MLVPKLIVAAVPTGVSLSLTSTPVPAATIPTSAEPSSAGNAPWRFEEFNVPNNVVADNEPLTVNVLVKFVVLIPTCPVELIYCLILPSPSEITILLSVVLISRSSLKPS